MSPSSALHHYVDVVFPVISVLLQESLVLGIFVVAWGQIRHLMREPSAARSGDFWRRVIILIALMLMVWMDVIAYSLIGEEAAVEEPVNPILFTAWTLLMVPVEILSVLVIAGMFAAIALPEFGLNDDAEENRNLTLELKISFALASVLHVLYFLWWFLLALFSGTVFSWFSRELSASPVDQPLVFNGGYQLFFACTFFGLFVWWCRVTRTSAYAANSERRDWQGAISYASVLATVYVTRFSQYMLNFPSLTEQK